MAQQVIISPLNPVRFVPEGTPTAWNFYGDWYRNLVRSYQRPDNYAQKWLPSATEIRLQITANYGPVVIDLYSCHGQLLNSYNGVVKATGLYDTGFSTYEFVIPRPNISDWWYLRLKVGFDVTLLTWISEPQVSIPTTPEIMTVRYSNTFNDQDIIFSTGIEFVTCVEAILDEYAPKVKQAVWEDQPLNLKTIAAVPYDQFKFVLGDGYGVPDYIAQKMNVIFACNKVFFDDVQFTRAEGSEWDATRTERYSRAGWRIDVRPTKNQLSLRGENNNNPAENFSVVYNINTKAFGLLTGQVSNAILQVTKVE